MLNLSQLQLMLAEGVLSIRSWAVLTASCFFAYTMARLLRLPISFELLIFWLTTTFFDQYLRPRDRRKEYAEILDAYEDLIEKTITQDQFIKSCAKVFNTDGLPDPVDINRSSSPEG